MKFKITNSTGKFPVFTMLLRTPCNYWCCYSVWHISHSREMCLCVFFCVFYFVCFRSRSHPVPHRGERVKQGKVHLRNIAIITSQNPTCKLL
jgi:hypothetical protein